MMVSKQDTVITVAVTPKLVEAFRGIRVEGKGGFQRLMREVADRITTADGVAQFTPEEFMRVAKYAVSYGEGGFQHKLRLLVTQWVVQHPDRVLLTER
jgi:hypothetical protein